MKSSIFVLFAALVASTLATPTTPTTPLLEKRACDRDSCLSCFRNCIPSCTGQGGSCTVVCQSSCRVEYHCGLGCVGDAN
ncbi:hypothetical protein EJ04DRAFT_134198 [Polyplosphaeria fusca]|uniref:Uncharacterized protein n=1 Tax=Polyplosphaeria fusca TaxID=682080 RepID=A0A9P4R4X2_9PLEO|nr:hypothetical protein EJ04DRAFT_134198 [Polyplosphaeria fusca]